MKTPLRKHLRTLPELRDTDRRHALYSDLRRLKPHNQQAYAANIAFWQTLILDSAQHGWLSSSATASAPAPHAKNPCRQTVTPPSTDDCPLLVCTIAQLQRLFTFRGDAPLGLDTVLHEMTQSGQVITLAQFEATPLARWTSWVFNNLIAGPLVWGLRQLSVVDDSNTMLTASDGYPNSHGNDSHQQYIFTPLLQQTARRIVDKQRATCHYTVTDNLQTFDQFRAQFYDCLPSQATTSSLASSQATLADSHRPTLMTKIDGHLLLLYLERDTHQVTTSRDHNGHIALIKFQSAKPGSPTSPISETDYGIVKLLSTRDRLVRQIDRIESRIAELTQLAKHALSCKRRHQALSYLRIKRDLTDTVLAHRMNALETMEQIITKVQTAVTDAELLTAYTTGAHTLQSVLDMHQLSPERVDEAFDQVQTSFADYQEIETTFQSRMDEVARAQDEAAGGLDVSDETLNRELQALLSPQVSLPPVSTQVEAPATVSWQASSSQALDGNRRPQSAAQAMAHQQLSQAASVPQHCPVVTAEPQTSHASTAKTSKEQAWAMAE
ncbi:hypothetical protein H4R34_004960 [Dimargaris verticillata]|uniref:Snf7-domain-containing protein n=1 Tax=Dimargaris verticillata TaxID=2761393 RepID=A0A9W8AXU2_9FUNG|nr:hypothetical protein H4R34_004960 [Dimargaris verticillata]